MASAALADIAATATAGYKELVWVGTDGQTYVMLEKPIVGDPDGGCGSMFRAFGVGGSQATAEAAALANLNNKRAIRYGFDAGVVSNGKRNVNAHTRDVT